MECMEKDSEEGIQDNQVKIKKFIDKFDQNSAFLKYFKDELKNAVVQLKLEEQFKGILDFESEPEILPKPVSSESPIAKSEPFQSKSEPIQ